MSRKELDAAFGKRAQMEKRMKEIIAYLTQPRFVPMLASTVGGDGKEPVGLTGNLLDADGYPRDDVDIFTVVICFAFHVDS